MIQNLIQTLITKTKKKHQEVQFWKEDLNKWTKRKEEKFNHLDNLEKARVIFQTASQITQNQLATKISAIVSTALQAVFPDPYTFKINFVKRRNTTECDLLFERNDQLRNPMDSCGYGVVDIASLALRVAYWKLNPDNRNILILDEPTRALSKDKQIRASVLLKNLSKLNKGLQFVIVTHNKDLAAAADKTFLIEQENGQSSIQEVSNEG